MHTALTAIIVAAGLSFGVGAAASAEEPAVTSDTFFTNDRGLTLQSDYLEMSTPFGEATTQTITLTATQDLTFRAASEYPTPGDSFYVTRAGVCPGYFGSVAMKAGDSCTLTIVFTPSTTASYYGGPSFTATVNGVTTPIGIHLHGNVETVVMDGPINFGTVRLGDSETLQYTLTNVARYDYTVTELFSGLATYYGFSIAGTSCGSVLPAGATCTIDLDFAPIYNFEASTYVYSTGTMDGQRAYSNGMYTKGTGSEGVVGLTATPTVDFGAVAEGETANGVMTLTNTGEVRLTFNTYNGWFSNYSGAFALVGELPAALEPGASVDLPVVFSADGAEVGEQTSDYNVTGYTSAYTAANAQVSLRALVEAGSSPGDPVDPVDPTDPGVPVDPTGPLVPTEPVAPTPPPTPETKLPAVDEIVVPAVTPGDAAQQTQPASAASTAAAGSLAVTGTHDSVAGLSALLLVAVGASALYFGRRSRQANSAPAL
ncbi:choice-of-anchor D domain-containing protein [Lysinibacter cavernae]|uniref:Choice-of-anchor D domain-containing protein n=1 Tax=Lysinibacter cavernae TaxID=1640652 RepID=A0A7X5R0W0_9MICO|nr:choice-of-anchor D domain-containing protein [Lysinibacter cavernae]NIH53546.1 hypothetical protein [Lysinibacter cavernae]